MQHETQQKIIALERELRNFIMIYFQACRNNDAWPVRKNIQGVIRSIEQRLNFLKEEDRGD